MNEIQVYIHCRRCMEEKPSLMSPKEFSKISIGKTPDGLQIWCDRHDEEIASFPFDWSDEPNYCECDSCKQM